MFYTMLLLVAVYWFQMMKSNIFLKVEHTVVDSADLCGKIIIDLINHMEEGTVSKY